MPKKKTPKEIKQKFDNYIQAAFKNAPKPKKDGKVSKQKGK